MSPQHHDGVDAAPRPWADLGGTADLTPDDGVLYESRCTDCGARAFPARDVCVACLGTDLAREPLPRSGTLYSFSTVHVSSARPTPYVLGYVDLPDGVRVLAEIVADGTLAPDLPVVLVTEDERWYFTPASAGEGSESTESTEDD